MAVKGVFASDQNIQGTKTGDFASGLLKVMPTGSAQLLALTSGMKSSPAYDTVITWFEENHLTGRIQVSAAVGGTVGDTTIPLVNSDEVVEGGVFLVESTGEYVYVESVAGLNLTVTRALGDPASVAAIADTSYLQKIGTAHEEGSSKPTSIANLGFPRFNYLQTFRNSWDVTGTAAAVNFHMGDLPAKNKADAAAIHAEDIERSILFGKRAIGVRNGKPFRMMDGITNQLSSNVQAQGANTTWTILDTFLQNIFSKNIKGQPNERIAYCGNTVLSVINAIARIEGTIDIKPGQTDFGLKVNKWLTPYGDISLMTHPLFNESPLWTKDLMVLHPAAIQTRYLRKTHHDEYNKDGTRAGVDGDYGVYTTEMSVEYKAEQTGGLFTGIDTAAAS